MASDDDGITLKGVPFYPGGRVPDGWVDLIADIASEQEASAQEVAESIAESAIVRVHDQLREEEDGVREVYKQMLDEIREGMDRNGAVAVRRVFGNIVTDHHSAFIEEQTDGGDLDPSKCLHVKDDGEQCGNDPVEGSDYCHIESHKPDGDEEGDD